MFAVQLSIGYANHCPVFSIDFWAFKEKKINNNFMRVYNVKTVFERELKLFTITVYISSSKTASPLLQVLQQFKKKWQQSRIMKGKPTNSYAFTTMSVSSLD